jgi:hypothetical protein
MTITYTGTGKFKDLVKKIEELKPNSEAGMSLIYCKSFQVFLTYNKRTGYQIENRLKGIKIHTHDHALAETAYKNEIYLNQEGI